MEFRILGTLEVVAANGQSLRLGSAQQRAVLSLLLIQAPNPVSRDRLIDNLWAERPTATAAHAVQVHISGIRKILGAGADEPLLQGSRAGYLLAVDPERIDGKRFERLVSEAQHSLAKNPAHARELFEQALGLWRGTPMADLAKFDFAAREADRLEELHADAVEGVVQARLALGQHVETIGQITSLVATNPLRETPRRLLMVALYRSGRHAEALAAYRDARSAFDQIGLEPSPELRQLEEAILLHDPSLGTLRQAAEVAAVPRPSPEGNGALAAVATAAAPVATQRRPAASVPRRKMVTAVSFTVMASTALGEELDPEALVEVMSHYLAELRATIERHGGILERFVGDAVMALFGIRRVWEDDALRAVRATAEIRERLPGVGEEVGAALSFRAGVNTGLALVSGGEHLAVGDAVNLATTLEQAATTGEILLGEETLRLVRDAVEVEPLGSLDVKGKSEAVPAFRLVEVNPTAPGRKRRLDAPLVGRDRELDLLRAAWDRAVAERGCHLFSLLGAAGVGKSRLVSELLTSLGDAATTLTGRCLHYGEGITFWPLIEALNPVGERASTVLEHLVSAGAATPEELFWEVRRLLESLALDHPLILHVDDLQWAETMLLDLIDHVSDLSRGSPILLLCTARPELLEDRPAWGGGKLNATTLLLEPLSAADCSRLLEQLGDGLAPDARARVIAASEGNPLFLEEMAAFARERGTFEVPPTIQALLTARLERLPIEERVLLERGAIEGEVFHARAVPALLDEHQAAGVAAPLAALVRKELIRPHPATRLAGEAFRFRHMLIRDAAYDALPKATRSRLHERFATWLEHDASDLGEFDEIAGWHLEQTIRYQTELARTVEPALARRAAQHLYSAGRRAGARTDVAAARNLLARAHALAPEASPLAARIGVDLAEQLMQGDDLARVDALLSAGEAEPTTSAIASLTRLEWLVAARPKEADPMLDQLSGMLERLASAGDERGLARGHLLAFWPHWLRCEGALAAEQLLIAAEHANRTGDEDLRSTALGWYVATLIYGPTPAEAVKDELEALEEQQRGPYLSACLELGCGGVERLDGRFAAARRSIEHAMLEFQTLGMRYFSVIGAFFLGETEFSAGQPERALEVLLAVDASLAQTGERSGRSTIQAHLARVYERLGAPESARAAVELSDELGTADDVMNQLITNPTRARLALADGNGREAERWARSAVEHASHTDWPVFQANASLELACILAALDRPQEAVTEARGTLDLYRAKGDRPGAAEAQALLDQLSDRADRPSAARS